MRYDLDELKASLPSYLDRVGVEVTRRTGSKLAARCPLHDDHRPSLTAEEKGGVWLWYCHRCQLGGTVIDLHASIHGIFPDDTDTIRGLAELMGLSSLSPSNPPRRPHRRQSARNSNRKADRFRHAKLTALLREKRNYLLAPFQSDDWKADLWHDSPLIIDMEPGAQASVMLRFLFPPEAVLWMGTPYDSGAPAHAHNFRACGDWLALESLPPRIAAGVFKPQSVSRSEAAVIARPYVVIESDELIGHKPRTAEDRDENRKLCAALLSFMRDRLMMNLRAVIDTGGKSLHGWFDRPTPEGMKALSTLLEGLAIDTAVFARCSSNPLRTPGCRHEGTGATARLLYLNPNPNACTS